MDARPRRMLLAGAILGSLALFAPSCAASTGPEAETAELTSQFETALADTMTEYDVPGAAVGVWIDGQEAWTDAAGLADIASGLEASTDQQWPLRSVTKSYTVTLILQLVDEGKLSLNDTIDQYLDGVTGGDTITLRQLADMSSGNADYTGGFLPVFLEDQTRIFTLDELNAFALGQPAQFAPGTEKVYTNANTNFLGAVVEKVTGQDYADALRERILEPLGQTGTDYILDVDGWATPHPTGYQPEGGEPEAQSENPSILGPAGSLFTTLDDAHVWAETLATGELLTDETQADRRKGAPLDAGPPYDQYALGMGETDGWWGHNGEGVGFTAAVFHQPERGASIVVFMNESNSESGEHPADQLFRRLAAIVDGAGS